MNSKNITTADSNHASELSDDALLDVFGGSTDYAAHTGDESAHGSQVTINIFIDADGSAGNGVSVGGKPVTSDTRGSGNTNDHGATTHSSGGSTTSTSSGSHHTNGSTTSSSGSSGTHGSTTSSGSGGTTTSSSGSRGGSGSTSSSDNHHTSTSGSNSTSKSDDKHEQGDHHHHGIREAFEAAHDRFHQELDHVSDGFDEIAHGVGAIATAAVELNPIVAGVHFLNDAHKKSSSSTTKKS